MINTYKLVFLSPKKDGFKQNNYWNTTFVFYLCMKLTSYHMGKEKKEFTAMFIVIL